MDITSILKQHQAWLEKAKTALGLRTVEKEELRLPLDVKRRHIEQLKMRAEQLATEKEAAVQQYDTSIAQIREQLWRLEAELSSDEKRDDKPAQGDR
jgi:hypothetical protein